MIFEYLLSIKYYNKNVNIKNNYLNNKYI